ncbi:MAG: short-chain dehydrogenase [Pseudonocardiales bacterium]|nr:short-chain dehydrogenase [Pseudonocardiales bacterium]
MELEGRTALITGAGATGGIGAEIARVFASEGADGTITGRNAEDGAQVLKELQEIGGQARFILADLREPDELTRKAAETGEVDIFINNAATFMTGPTLDVSVDSFDEGFATNVRAPYFLTAALVPAMMAKGSGSIINISSMSVQVAIVGTSIYSASKAALESLTRTWALEFGAAGVRVNTIMLGSISSEKVSGRLGPERRELFRLATPNQRIGTPAEVAQAALFLAGERSSFITGAFLAVDGGRTVV